MIKEIANRLNNPGSWYEASFFKECLGKLIMAMTSTRACLQIIPYSCGGIYKSGGSCSGDQP